MDITYKETTTDHIIHKLSKLKPTDYVAVDTEVYTKGSDRYGTLSSIAFYNPKFKCALLLTEWEKGHGEELRKLCSAMEDSLLKYIFHNASYDLSHMYEEANKTYKILFEDTLFMSRIVYPTNERYGLYELPRNNCPTVKASKALQKSKFIKGNFSEEQKEYAATDAYVTYYVYETALLQPVPLRADGKRFIEVNIPTYKLHKQATQCSLEWQGNGVPVDIDRVRYLIGDKDKELKAINPADLNVCSPRQVKTYLSKFTEEPLADTSAGTLAGLAYRDKIPQADIVIKARRLRKLLTYLEKWSDLNKDRLSGRYSWGSKSGRSKCDSYAMQTIPRKLTKCFGYVDNTGDVLIYSDFSQLELRTIAALTKESFMIDTFKEGKDIHGLMAEKIFGTDYTSEQRYIAKQCNFSLLYGGSASTIQTNIAIDSGLWFEEDELAAIIRKWRKEMRGICSWQSRMYRRWQKGNLHKTPFGFPYSADRGTQFLNIQNQGAGAEVAKIALCKMHKVFTENNMDARILNFVHDSYLISSGSDYKEVCDVIVSSMQKAWSMFNKQVLSDVEIPMPIEVKVGYNWGDMEDDNNILFKKEVK